MKDRNNGNLKDVFTLWGIIRKKTSLLVKRLYSEIVLFLTSIVPTSPTKLPDSSQSLRIDSAYNHDIDIYAAGLASQSETCGAGCRQSPFCN